MASSKKTAAANYIQKMNERAEELSKVRAEIRVREEKWKEETDHLFARERELKESLLDDLQSIGLSSVKVASGESYFISKTHDFEIKNPLQYDSWARDQRCVRIDKLLVKQRLNAALKKGELPEFVQPVERETISVRQAKS